MARAGREGWAFAGTFVTIGAAVAGLFLALFPDVMPLHHRRGVLPHHDQRLGDRLHPEGDDLVALVFTPVVLCYQAWTYWVFRRRIGTHHIPAHEQSPSPPDASRSTRAGAPTCGRRAVRLIAGRWRRAWPTDC